MYYFEIYDYVTGNPLNQIEFFDFGDIIINQHCHKPVLFRLHSDSASIGDKKMFLENSGTIDADYGYYTSNTFLSLLESGDSRFTHLVESPDATTGSPHGVSIGWDGTRSDWVWLDTQVSETGVSSPNFRFLI